MPDGLYFLNHICDNARFTNKPRTSFLYIESRVCAYVRVEGSTNPPPTLALCPPKRSSSRTEDRIRTRRLLILRTDLRIIRPTVRPPALQTQAAWGKSFLRSFSRSYMTIGEIDQA